MAVVEGSLEDMVKVPFPTVSYSFVTVGRTEKVRSFPQQLYREGKAQFSLKGGLAFDGCGGMLSGAFQ